MTDNDGVEWKDTTHRADVIRALDLLDELQDLGETLGLFGEEILAQFNGNHVAIENMRQQLQVRLGRIEGALKKQYMAENVKLADYTEEMAS